MYGLDKKGKGPVQFDLEVDLRNDPVKAKKLMKEIEAKIFDLKNLLRQGAETEDFDEYGILLHGYAALQRILTKIQTKKK